MIKKYQDVNKRAKEDFIKNNMSDPAVAYAIAKEVKKIKRFVYWLAFIVVISFLSFMLIVGIFFFAAFSYLQSLRVII